MERHPEKINADIIQVSSFKNREENEYKRHLGLKIRKGQQIADILSTKQKQNTIR